MAGSWPCGEWGFPPPRVTAQDTGLEQGVGADIVGDGRKRVDNCEGISGLQLLLVVKSQSSRIRFREKFQSSRFEFRNL